VTPSRRSAQVIDSSSLPKNINEPMGAPAIFEKRIEIKLLHSASTLKSRIQVNSSDQGGVLVFVTIDV
jgi:hypothetical protein